MEEVNAIIKGQMDALALELIGLLITMSIFAIITFVVTGYLKIPWQLRKGLAAFSVLVGIYVWFKYFPQ